MLSHVSIPRVFKYPTTLHISQIALQCSAHFRWHHMMCSLHLCLGFFFTKIINKTHKNDGHYTHIPGCEIHFEQFKLLSSALVRTLVCVKNTQTINPNPKPNVYIDQREKDINMNLMQKICFQREMENA